MFINDMFFFHERARKINIWAGFIILSESTRQTPFPISLLKLEI
jgi:hypothetical protein